MKIGKWLIRVLIPSERKVPGMTMEEMRNVDVRTVDREPCGCDFLYCPGISASSGRAPVDRWRDCYE